MEENQGMVHKIVLNNRNQGNLTGILDVISFDENTIVLDTDMGLLTIKGKDLHVNRLSLEKGEIDKLMNSPSIYKCLSCFACVERCPRGVEPAKVVEAVRLQVIRKQGANHMTPDDIPALLDDDLPQQAIVTAMRKYSK